MTNREGYARDVAIAAEWITQLDAKSKERDNRRRDAIHTICSDYGLEWYPVKRDIRVAIQSRGGR